MHDEILEAKESSALEPRLRRRALVVVGMHRSGTSAMTRVLSLLGATLPKNLIEAHEDNRSGFWESQSVANLNEEILGTVDSHWDDVFVMRPRPYLSSFDRTYVGRATELLNQEFNGSDFIVLKDPRISVLAQFWERVLKDAGFLTHYVIMLRNPLEVADSLRVRDGFPREKSLLLWASYMLALERDTRSRNRTFVSYDQLMSGWRDVRKRIEENMGVPFPRDSAAAALEIDAFLEDGLRNHKAHSEELFSRSDLSEEVKALYRILSDACQGESLDRSSLERIAAELSKIEAVMGPVVADLRGTTRSLATALTNIEADRDRVTQEAQELRSRAEELTARLSDAEEERLTQAAALRRLEEDLASLAADRDRVVKETHLLRAEAAEITVRLSEAKEERRGQAASLRRLEEELAAAEQVRRQLELRENELRQRQEEIEQTRTELKQSRAEVDELARAIKQARQSLEQTASQLEQEKARTIEVDARCRVSEQRAETERVAREDAQREQMQLRDLLERERSRLSELERTRDELEQSLRARMQELRDAGAAADAKEAKLADRFQELATLTNMLKQEQKRSSQADDHVRWLAALNQGLAKHPRWWGLMPTSWVRRQVLGRLRSNGLFDSQAYLDRYPDVAAEGMDPLEHYLKHGLSEGRQRKF